MKKPLTHFGLLCLLCCGLHASAQVPADSVIFQPLESGFEIDYGIDGSSPSVHVHMTFAMLSLSQVLFIPTALDPTDWQFPPTGLSSVHTWGSRFGSPELTMLASSVSSLGVNETFPGGIKLYRGQAAHLRVDMLLIARTSGYVNVGLNGICFGTAPDDMSNYITGDRLQGLSTGSFYLKAGVVPEPSTVALILLALTAFLLILGRSRSRS